MIPGVAFEPAAIRDAEEVFAYLASQEVAVARRFNEAVIDTAISARDNPSSGVAWQGRSSRERSLRWKRIQGFKNYLLFYHREDGGIVVVRILHGARDIELILSE